MSLSINGTGNATYGLATDSAGNIVTTTYDPTWYANTIYQTTTVNEMFVAFIPREELKYIDLDRDSLDKMMKGTREDIMVAVELLKTQTKYAWRIIQELKVNNNIIENIGYIIRDYLNSNVYSLNLNFDIK